MNLHYFSGPIWEALFRAIHVCLAVTLLALTSISFSYASERTERFVQDSLRKGYEILNDKGLSDIERIERFERFLYTVVDFRRTALFTIGAYANRSHPDEIEEFVESFRRYITATVKTNLEDVRDYSPVLRGSSDRAFDDSIVLVELTNLQTQNGEGIQAAFRVRNDATDKPIIVDIQFEGIWLALTERADYSSFLARNGGKLSALSEFLDRVVLESNMTDEIPE